MATILLLPAGKAKKGFNTVKIDMTPMVDLGFLLITFFIFTTSMMQPTVTQLTMPKESNVPAPVYEKTLLTVILDNNKVWVYEGALNKALAANKLMLTNYHVQRGLGYLIRQKQQSLGEKKEELMVAIKPLSSTNYQDLMNALDEMLINHVTRYGVMSLSQEEKDAVLHGNR